MASLAPLRVGWVVAEEVVLYELPQNVDPEAVHTPVEPEAQHVVHGLPDLRVAPVEVGLLGIEEVEVVLLRSLVPLPRAAAAEVALPVVGRPSARSRVAPEVPLPFRVIAGGAGLHEPGVLVGGMVRDVVEDHPHPAPVRAFE